jgi:hypothetical protein
LLALIDGRIVEVASRERRFEGHCAASFVLVW